VAGQGTLATTAIITKGLTGGHAPLDPCKSGLITTPFSLYCTGILPPPPVSGGGGPYPYDAWNKFNPGDIKNFYQPVNQTYYVVPRDQEHKYFKRHTLVTIGVKFGKFSTEKEYLVPLKNARAIVKVFNLMEVTKERIDVTVSNVKRVITDAVVAVKNFRLKK
jgi:hypothetical protein